ncbi:MAG TPA: hypothetical protein DF613_15845 [Lachnospiraceae bacterium]|nr:hypothetical protein [Lachnospiraceae bacterium]
MKTMKKNLLSLMVLLSAVLLLPGAVHAKTKTESLNTSVKAFVKAAKEMDEKQLSKYVKNWDEYSLESAKKIMPKFYRVVKKNASKVTYKVVSKKVKGNTATVVLQVKYPKYTKAINRMVKALKKYYEKKYGSADMNMDVPNDLSEAEIQKLVNEMMSEMDAVCAKAVKDCPKSGMATKKIKVIFVKSGSRWVVKEMPKSLANALFCDLIASSEKADTMTLLMDSSASKDRVYTQE